MDLLDDLFVLHFVKVDGHLRSILGFGFSKELFCTNSSCNGSLLKLGRICVEIIDKFLALVQRVF